MGGIEISVFAVWSMRQWLKLFAGKTIMYWTNTTQYNTYDAISGGLIQFGLFSLLALWPLDPKDCCLVSNSM
jgi:hypothetical protein